MRDYSANDFSVSAVNRGKYLAFTETGSNGMRHLKALADAGLTDVHLLPVFDIAAVPESGCSAVSTGGAADSEDQQNAVFGAKSADCFNWERVNFSRTKRAACHGQNSTLQNASGSICLTCRRAEAPFKLHRTCKL